MNPDERYKRRLRRVQIGGHVISTVVECVVTLEILWYYTHDGRETLHEAVAAWWQDVRARARERNRIRRTLDMIRDLPESE